MDLNLEWTCPKCSALRGQAGEGLEQLYWVAKEHYRQKHAKEQEPTEINVKVSSALKL